MGVLDAFRSMFAKAQPEKRKKKKTGRGMPRKSQQQAVLEALTKTYQRTHRDFIPCPPAGCQGYSMDAAPNPAHELPDVYGMQTNMPPELLGWFASQGFIGHQLCAILAQHWLIGKACSQPARDAVQYGYTVEVDGGGENAAGVTEALEAFDKDRDVVGNCRELVRNANISGIRHALFVVDGIDYELPFNLDGVTPYSYRGISQIDPYWLTPELDYSAISNPADMNFYEPTYWRMPNGQRVHRSHFVMVKTDEVQDVLKPTYYYGGIPLPQQIFERVYAAERTANEAPELAVTKRLLVMNAQIDEYLNDENEVTERVKAMQELRDNFGFYVIDSDDNVVQIDTSLADFDALIMSQYQLVASIARMPATELLGTTPKGFNATGEHETKAYKRRLSSIQTNDMSPLVQRHHALAVKSHLAPKFGEGIMVSHKWNAEPPTPEEIAELNSKKADTGQKLSASGAITSADERVRIMNDPDSGYSHIGLMEEENEEEGIDDLLREIGGDDGKEAADA